MRNAQWISSVIYLAFLALLTPLLRQAAGADGVAGIVEVFATVAGALAYFVLAGAFASQAQAVRALARKVVREVVEVQPGHFVRKVEA